jgi:5-methyltetrahydrofolate--homocysteine methyltransferase
MLDGVYAMTKFLNLIAAEPIFRVHDWQLKMGNYWGWTKGGAGKSVVNSISLKRGEEQFIHHAKLIKRYGAAVLCDGFDEGAGR